MSRIPNVPERVKEAPAHALRAVFAGIGQALLLSDRMRRKLKSQQDEDGGNGQGAAGTPVSKPGAAGPVTRPAAQMPAAAAAAPVATTATTPPTAKAPAAQPTASTPAPAAPATAKTAAATAPPAEAPAAKASAAKTRATKAPAATVRDTVKPSATPAEAAPRTPPAGETAAPPLAPPIPNYDELSVASLRARLRGLDLAQVRQLLGYEKAHGGRSDVIAMYERRIEKLRHADGAAAGPA